YDAIFTLGGDGTVMGVLQALAQTGIPVGVLPGGTGNLLARALRVPLSVPKAVAALCRGYFRDVDVARLGDGRLFAFAAGVGIDATMVMETSIAAKRRFGVAAYVGAATRATLALDRFILHAMVDGVSHRLTATTALVANFGAVLHGALHLGPSILENDGMLDLCVFSPASVRDALRLGWRIARRDFATDPAMHFFRGRHIHLETEPPRGVQADGDYLGVGTLDATVLPGAARLLVPSSPAQAVTS
ncbi:MAG: diacylglycerol kinase family protein, partial [Gemmatimonadaceae bacterium]